MLTGKGINLEIINCSADIIEQRLKNFYTEHTILRKKLSDRNAEYFDGPDFQISLQRNLALQRNFNKREKESIM